MHLAEEPLESLLLRLERREIEANKGSCLALLSRCIDKNALWIGRRIHQQMARTGVDQETFMENHLIRMYAKCGSLDEARNVFQNSHKNFYSWKIMLAAFAQAGHMEEAAALFERMPEQDVVSWNIMVDGLAQSGRLQAAKNIFDQIPEKNTVCWNTMLSAYARNGHLHKASSLFNQIPEKTAASWNVMITAFSDAGDSRAALLAFALMDLEGQQPNVITLVKVLSACNQVEDALLIHASIESSGFHSAEPVLIALISAFGKCGSVEKSRGCFDRLHHRDVVSWTAMITAYAGNNLVEQAMNTFWMMNSEGVKPSRVTLTTIFNACAISNKRSFLSAARAIHFSLTESGLDLDASTATALVDMYGKCGSLKAATAVFNRIPEKNFISWSAIIAAHGQNGVSPAGVELFRMMLQNGVDPNEITILNVLASCSRGGLVETGCTIFTGIQYDYSLQVSPEHHLCMIDLLGRAGEVDRAEQLVIECKAQQHHHHQQHESVAASTLLAACKLHGNLEVAGSQAFAVDHQHPGPEAGSPYVIISNLCSASASASAACDPAG